MRSTQPLPDNSTSAVNKESPTRLLTDCRDRQTLSPTVMKFGGTAVGDSSCISRVIEIVRLAAQRDNVIVVVSAMSGVTSELVAALTLRGQGKHRQAVAILHEIRKKHMTTAAELLTRSSRLRIFHTFDTLVGVAEHLLESSEHVPNVTPQMRDTILALGERLSSPLISAALAEAGVAAEPVDATELILTDANHGSATPQFTGTRERSRSRLKPLVERQVIPVVTGFIGATADGVLTTLGRNSSDCTATVLAASMDAKEVIIWTDVDGILTADPRLVPDAVSIPEIAYEEASQLAECGAKVLHPGTLATVAKARIPVVIRNVFCPERPGTKIGPTSSSGKNGANAVITKEQVTLVKITGSTLSGFETLMKHVPSIAESLGAIRLWVAPVEKSVNVLVPSIAVNALTEILRKELNFTNQTEFRMQVCSETSLITVIGLLEAAVHEKILKNLDKRGIKAFVLPQDSESTRSFIVAERQMKAAAILIHDEIGRAVRASRSSTSIARYVRTSLLLATPDKSSMIKRRKNSNCLS